MAKIDEKEIFENPDGSPRLYFVNPNDSYVFIQRVTGVQERIDPIKDLTRQRRNGPQVNFLVEAKDASAVVPFVQQKMIRRATKGEVLMFFEYYANRNKEAPLVVFTAQPSQDELRDAMRRLEQFGKDSKNDDAKSESSNADMMALLKQLADDNLAMRRQLQETEARQHDLEEKLRRDEAQKPMLSELDDDEGDEESDESESVDEDEDVRAAIPPDPDKKPGTTKKKKRTKKKRATSSA